MASYTITGHPLNVHDLALTPGAAVDPALVSTLNTKGVGSAVTLTLSGTVDTNSKACKILT